MSRTATGLPRLRLLPILAGTAVDVIGTLVASTLLVVVVAMLRGPGVFAQLPTGPIIAGWMFLGCLFTVLGAFVAGLMARQREVVHGLGVAIVGSVVGLWFDQSGSPRWLPLAALLAGLLAGAAGGWLAGWTRRGEASSVENAPSEPPAVEIPRRRHRMAFTAAISALVVCLLAWIGLTRPAAQRPTASLRADHVYFVPIHAAPELIDQLKEYYRNQLGLEIEVLPAVQADSASYDSSRQQLIAEELVTTLENHYGSMTANGRAVLIGITSWDMYPRSRPWQFAFAWRSAPYAVVSYARMNLPTWDERPDQTLVLRRLRKMVTRALGVLAFRLNMNSNRRSLMYEDIMGLDDLDLIDEDLERAGFPVK